MEASVCQFSSKITAVTQQDLPMLTTLGTEYLRLQGIHPLTSQPWLKLQCPEYTRP